MKAKLLCVFATLVLCIVALTSCLTVPGATPGGAKNLYSIVCNDTTVAAPVREAFYQAYGKMCSVYDDTETASGTLIVLGETSHPATAYAKEQLRKQLSSSSYDDAGGYIICEYEGNVAVWWTSVYFADAAIGRLIDDYVAKKAVPLAASHKYSEVDSTLAFRKAQELAHRDSLFAEVSEELGADVALSLRKLYDLYDDGLYKWMANLYDPGVGGYYYANSALENGGYLPDLESTKQALAFLMDSGMLNSYGGNMKALNSALPVEMRDSLIGFVHSLQSSYDGYYYHPQWPAVADSRSRDVNWAVQILEAFGEKPLYTTSTGVQGSLGAPGVSATAFTCRLSGGSAVIAASSVVAANSYTSIYESEEAFTDYFYTLPWGTDSYTAGGQLSGRSREIRNAGFGELCVALMDAEQEKVQQQRREMGLEPNGLWEVELSYRSVNGIMKITSTYTVLGGKINYAQEMIGAAMEILLLGKDINGKTVENAVYVYNPWVAIDYCLSNLEEFESEEEMRKYRALVLDSAPALLDATTRDAARFRVSDGSFSIVTSTATDGTKKGSKYELYGLPHSVAGVEEGDVNGATIISSSILREINSILGVHEFLDVRFIPMYYDTDMEAYLDIIDGLDAIVKDPVQVECEYDFENENLGASNGDIMSLSVAQLYSAGDLRITSAPTSDGGKGQVLRFNKLPYTSKGDKFAVNALQSANTYCYVLEWDMLIDEVIPAEGKTSSTILQVKLGECYCLVVEWDNGKLRLSDMDNNTTLSTGITTTMDQWHTFRLEYYHPNDLEAYVKIYVDDVYAGASNNFVGRAEGKKPSSKFNTAEFFALRAANFIAYFDNISIDKRVQDVTSGDEPPVFLPRVEFDFENEVEGATNSDILCTSFQKLVSGELSIVDGGTEHGNVLKFYTTPNDVGGDNVNFRTPTDDNSYCYALEWDMMMDEVISTTVSSTLMQIKLSDCYWLVLIYEGGQIHLADLNDSAGTAKRLLDEDGEAVTLDLDAWYNIRIEYYPGAEGDLAQIYVDGDLVATSSNFKVTLPEGAGEDYVPTPSDKYTVASFFALRRASFTAYFDNIVTEKLAENAD